MRVLRSATSSKQLPPKPHQYWAVNDVVLYMFKFLALVDLLPLTHLNHHLRARTMSYLRGRVTRYTAPFFLQPTDLLHTPTQNTQLTNFFDVLDDTASWIVGSVALAVASTLSDPPRPDNLNIIALQRRAGCWYSFMIDCAGFVPVYSGQASGAYARTGSIFSTFQHPLVPAMSVTITFTPRRHLGFLFFASPNTDQLVAISASEIITPYLDAVSAQAHILGWRPTMRVVTQYPITLHPTYRVTTAFPGAIDLHNSTKEWTRPCGSICPGKRRYATRLEGISHIQWVTDETARERPEDLTLHIMGRSKMWFRTGISCRNATCPLRVTNDPGGRGSPGCTHRSESMEGSRDDRFAEDATTTAESLRIFEDEDGRLPEQLQTLPMFASPAISGPRCPASLTLHQHAVVKIVEGHHQQALRAAPQRVQQLLMFVRGPAGSGKSSLILALEQLFVTLGQPQLFAKTACTVPSAALIGGHAVAGWAGIPAGLSSTMDWLHRPTPAADTRILAAAYLAIDHWSMLSCEWLVQLEAKLSFVRARFDPLNNLPFGGLNIIIFGDTHGQRRFLRPGTPFYHEPTNATEYGRRGQQLNSMFQTVVTLEHATAEPDDKWARLLAEMRAGRATNDGTSTLGRRTLTNRSPNLPNFYKAPWATAPLIATHCAVVAKWNAKALLKHRRLTGHTIYVIKAEDRFAGVGGKRLNAMEQERLAQLPVKITRLPTLVALAVGAPVFLQHGGSWDLAHIIDITPDAREIPANDDMRLVLDHLPTVTVRLVQDDQLFVVPPSTSTFRHEMFEDGISGIVERRQIKMRLAFAMLAHEAHGHSFEAVILDLATPPMMRPMDYFLLHSVLSKARSVDTVIILRTLATPPVVAPPALIAADNTVTALSTITMIRSLLFS
ncbi:hypothetical protein B0H15DRAFT_948920 [Mycena belliarum]|uniref:ATP-dependent DNA helicase n=1 Tax=Mycena belliarum TaxID=1033014 RepID=A0AAD6U4N8_9AGAR|nr:hypothetical protein B0H15DRAFT_948920 [Mycena belliae]